MSDKKSITLMSVFMFILFLGGFSLYFFIYWTTPQVPSKLDSHTRIISYNLKNAYSAENQQDMYDRIELLSNQVKTYAPDIIGFQEADSPWMYDDGTAIYTTGLPVYLKDNYDYVSQVRGDITGEANPIFYLKDKYDLLNSGTFWYSDTPDVPSLTWGSDTFNRICTWAELLDKTTNEKLTVFNTHFDHESIESQEKATKLLLEKVEQVAHSVFVLGDFNFTRSNSNYKALVNGGLTDSKKSAETVVSHGTINYFLNFNTQLFPVIDFVFYKSDQFRAVNYFVDNNYKFQNKPISDHFPVIVDFKK